MILAILQARMSSTRLPGKVMLPLAGAPMIQRQIERVQEAANIDELIVATSDQASDVCNIGHQKCANFITDLGKFCIIQFLRICTKTSQNNFGFMLLRECTQLVIVNLTSRRIFHLVANKVVEFSGASHRCTVS